MSYCVELSEDEQNAVEFLESSKLNPDYHNGYVMLLNRPLIRYVDGIEYRRIPNFIEYMVSSAGRILRTHDLKPAAIHRPGKDFYPSAVLLLERYRHSVRSGVHRLTAHAWCLNDDPRTKLVVNHKDTNKHNFEHRNLEWVTHSENAAHAFASGLRTDNIRVKIRDKETGDIVDFYSLGEMARYLGITRARDPSYFENGPAYRLISGRYEVRTERDTRPWYYEIKGPKIPKSRYKTTVTFPDGTTEVYWDNRDIIKRFKCWNVSSGIESVVAKAKSLNPQLEFSVEDRWKDRIVQVMDVRTMSIVDESPWVREAATLMQCSRSAVERRLRLKDQSPRNGYAVRYKTEEPWDIPKAEKVDTRMRVQVFDNATGTSTMFNSLREIEREMRISRFISKRALETKRPYGKFTFTKIDDLQSPLSPK